MTSNIRRDYHILQLQRPTQAQIDECTARTAALLGLNQTGRITAVRDKVAAMNEVKAPVHVVRTSAATGETRIIQIHTARVDPIAPISGKLKKKQQREPSPPPVSYVDSSLQKTTQAELALWKIPTAVSNWTNSKKKVIDLGIRMGVDDTQTNQINISDKHAQFTSALDESLRSNRDEVLARKQMEQMVQQTKRERELFEMELLAKQIQLGETTTQLSSTTPQQSIQYGTDLLQPTMNNDYNNNNGYNDDINEDGLSLEEIQQRIKSRQQLEQLQQQVIKDDEALQRTKLLQQRQRLKEKRDELEKTQEQPTSIIDQFDKAELTFGSGAVDDHVLALVNDKHKNINNLEEDVYEDDMFDTSSSRQLGRTPASYLLNADNENNLGVGALTRDIPVLFQKGHTISSSNSTTTTSTTNNNDNNSNTTNTQQEDRDRDRNYG